MIIPVMFVANLLCLKRVSTEGFLQDPGDLILKANQRVLVTEKTSADW